MRRIADGDYVAEEFYQEKMKEYAEAKMKKRQERLARKATKAAERAQRKKWFGIILQIKIFILVKITRYVLRFSKVLECYCKFL